MTSKDLVSDKMEVLLDSLVDELERLGALCDIETGMGFYFCVGSICSYLVSNELLENERMRKIHSRATQVSKDIKTGMIKVSSHAKYVLDLDEAISCALKSKDHPILTKIKKMNRYKDLFSSNSDVEVMQFIRKEALQELQALKETAGR